MDGCQCGEAGEVEEHKHKEAESCGGSDAIGLHVASQYCLRGFILGRGTIFGGIKHAQCGGYDFLGAHTCHKGHVEFPVEAEGFKEGLYQTSGLCYIALLKLLFCCALRMVRKIS